jgi:alpha-galactosidase
MHANSIISLEVDGNALVLSGNAGVDDESGRGTVVFKVQADGKEIWNSGLMKPKDAAKEFSLDVKGVKSLVLLVADGGDGIDGDHADWGNLKVTMTSGKPSLIVPPIEEAVVLTPKPAPTPRITGARLFGVRPGSPFLFTVTSTGDRPMTFSADGLPSGLQLDAQSGRITGKLDKEGEYVVTLQAKNELGHAERKLKIVCGSQIGLTPAMGWNSWNCFANAVTEERVKSAADAMVNSGLINHGWIYINIDDYWQVHRNSRDATLQGPARAADGRILPNPRFPDMKALTESDQAQVALQDYAGGTAATTARYYLQPLPIRRGQRLGMGDRGQWQFLAHHGDINDSWGSMANIGFNQAGREKYAGPGHFNDPDMLVVDKVGWGRLHPTRLSPNEQYTHISLWCLLASPLLIGCDMTQLDEFTLGLLENDEVIEVNQDPLGRQAARVAKNGMLEVWAKDMEDGSKAVGLFNRGSGEASITANWADLGLSGEQAGSNYVYQASSNLLNWTTLLNFNCTNSIMNFQDTSATGYARRFYRIKPQ